MWEILPNNADWDYFKILTSWKILKIRNPLLEERCAYSEVIHLFQQVGCVRNKLQFHTSTESEIISVDAGLRLDGLPASELWDLIVSVLGNMTHTTAKKKRPVIIDRSQQSQGKIDMMSNIDSVPSNVQSPRQEALWYVFEGSEAMVKMIIRGRSPTMRYVSRTHRVALDWLLDWINFDPKIQIEYIDTKKQLADMLTEGNFTRDEWNHFLVLV